MPQIPDLLDLLDALDEQERAQQPRRLRPGRVRPVSRALPPVDPNALYSVTEAAQRLKLARTTVYAHVHAGRLTLIRVKGRSFIRGLGS